MEKCMTGYGDVGRRGSQRRGAVVVMAFDLCRHAGRGTIAFLDEETRS